MMVKIDWSILRGATIMFVLSVIISGALLGGSLYYRGDMKTEYDKQRARYINMSGRYLTVDEEERTIESYYPLYQAMERDGVIGEEQRLDWIDTLRAVASNIKLPALRYEISARAPYTPDFAIDTGVFQLYSSNISLRMGLFHEGDLIAMLAALERNSPGIFSVNSCDLKRRGSDLQRNPSQPNIVADCDLRWVTLKPKVEL